MLWKKPNVTWKGQTKSNSKTNLDIKQISLGYFIISAGLFQPPNFSLCFSDSRRDPSGSRYFFAYENCSLRSVSSIQGRNILSLTLEVYFNTSISEGESFCVRMSSVGQCGSMDNTEDMDEERLCMLYRVGRSDADDDDRVRNGGDDLSTLSNFMLLFSVSALSNALVKFSRAFNFSSESFSYSLKALRKSSAASE